MTVAAAGLLACGAPGSRGASTASDVPRAAQGPSPFDGLVPCSKDDTSASCAKPGAKRPANPGESIVWKVPIGPDDPVWGPGDALVTVVVFSDFECPYCKRESAELTRLREGYARDLRLVWKDCPSSAHGLALPAAQFARAVRAVHGDPGFWAAAESLFASQGSLGDALFQKLAADLHVEWPAVRAAIAGARYGGPIHAGLDLADRVDVTATPTTFVNGRKIVGAQPYDTLEATVKAELDRAKRALDSGTPRARLYETLIADGRQITPPSDAPR